MIRSKLISAGRNAIHVLCALSIAVPQPLFAQESLLVELERSAERLRASAERLRPALDRSLFDLDALLDSKEYEAAKIIEFVTNEIDVEIYNGSLRGALGTVVSGAGNALDQALLVATLLQDAGYDVVIRRGRLGDVDANRLIDRMFASKNVPGSVSLASPPALDDAERAVQAARRQAWISAADAQADRLAVALENVGIEFGEDRVFSELLAEAGDYFWVEYRDGPNATWQAVHPALGRAPEADTEATYTDGLPAELTHQVIIEVLVDQRRGNETHQSSLFNAIQLLGPELTDLVLQISLLPDQLLNGKAPLDAARIADDTTFIYPIVNGGMPAGARALSMRGFLVPMELMDLGAADYFDTVSEKGAQAIDAVAALSESNRAEETRTAIEALRMRVTFRAPDGSERTDEREWFSESRDLGEASYGSADYRRALVTGLSRSYQFSFATGAINESYILDPLLENLQALESVADAAESIDPESCASLDCFLNLDFEPVTANRAVNALFLAFDDIDSASPGPVVRYRHVPGLYIESAPHLPLSRIDAGAGLRLDIVSNARRSLIRKDGTISTDVHRQLRGGAWETQIETDVFGQRNAVPQSPNRGDSALRQVKSVDVEPFLEKSSVARAIKRDLDNGFTILANAEVDLAVSDTRTRWWRVDPTNAETLGMNHYGGGVSTEALVKIAVVMITLVAHASLTAYCMHTSGEDAGTCFYCTNYVSGAGMMANAALRTIGWNPESYFHFFLHDLGQLYDQCIN